MVLGNPARIWLCHQTMSSGGRGAVCPKSSILLGCSPCVPVSPSRNVRVPKPTDKHGTVRASAAMSTRAIGTLAGSAHRESRHSDHRIQSLVLAIVRNQQRGPSVLRRQGPERIHALRRPNARGIERGTTTRSFHAHIAHRAIPVNLEVDVGLRAPWRVWVHHRPETVGAHFAIDAFDVPPKHAAKIAVAHRGLAI